MKYRFKVGFLVPKDIYNLIESVNKNTYEYDLLMPEGFITREFEPFYHLETRPKSGDFFILDAEHCGKWKKDFHSWDPKYN